MFAVAPVPYYAEPSYSWLAILTLALFKIATIVAGVAIVYLGYRLFALGVVGTTDVDGKVHDFQLTLKRAAPGSIFALFGALVLGLTVYRGMELKIPEHFTGTVSAPVSTQAEGYYEYRTEPIPRGAELQQSLQDLVNALAKDRWELVTLAEQGKDDSRQLIGVFRRYTAPVRATGSDYEVEVLDLDTNTQQALDNVVETRRKKGWELLAVTEQTR